MSKSKRDLFEDKACLIYEFNKKSPLFVQQANKEISNNNIDEAISILESGLLHFPTYLTAKVLLARAQALKGNYSNSLKLFKSVYNFCQSKDSFNFYVQEIENVKKQKSAFEINRRVSTWVDIPEEMEYQSIPKSDSIDDRLSEIAQKISSIKLNDSTRSQQNESLKIKQQNVKEKSITSETMAKIFVAQGEFSEAINIYKKLVLLKPDRKTYFESKIAELEKRLEL